MDPEEEERIQDIFNQYTEAKRAQSSGKKKGLGGLGPEKKKLLKKLIMEKAQEEMRAEAKKKAEEKDNFIKQKVPSLSLDGLNQSQLESKIKELYSKWKHLEEEKYDCEMKIRKQDFEINDLNAKVSDIKGKFVKPVLKKVSKTESKLARFGDKKGGGSDFRNSLKSTGQSKYQLEEKEEASSKVDFRAQMKGEGEGGEEGAVEAEAE